MTDVPANLLEYPDTVLYDGKILTVDEDFSVVEAVAIRDGRFFAVGSTSEVTDLAGPDTAEIDLGGRVVVPGLIDSHVHQRQVGIDLTRVALFDVRTIGELLEAVAEAAMETPAGGWIRSTWGWHESQLEEDRLPTRDELDEFSPDNPVFIPRGGHVAVLNSAALADVGIDRDTPDPDGGTIVRDPETGRATGVVLESARTQLVHPHLPERTYEDYLDDIRRAMEELNSRGVTGAMEPGLEREELRAYQQIHTQGEATVRTDALVRVYDLDDVEDAASYFYRGFGDDRFKVGGVKYMIDGGVEGGRLKAPYEVVEGVQEQEDFHGHYLLPPGGVEELEAMCVRTAELGHQLQAHAVGDAAIETLLDAYEVADEAVGIGDLRWTVMHLFLPEDEHLQRMEAMDVLATLQNHPTYLGRNMEKLWGHQRASSAIPLRDVVDSPIPVGGGTDAPVVPWYPFESIWWMVTRETVTAGTLGPEQAISREEALELWTRGSAYTMDWEDDVGSIEPGKLADLAVLDTDFLECDPEDLREIGVEMTMVDGEVVHATDGAPERFSPP